MIHNKTKGFTIIANQKIARNILRKGLGLMFRSRPDYCLIFPFKNSKKVALTMWFVFFPVDVLFLDEHKKVVDIKKDFRPFTHYTPKNKASFILEFPAGVLGQTGLGDEIEINGL
ncbi:DUF192 domain-containing protein [Candidatus Woesearchaeota archaeon]|nr:DUF192 domain-containing protein [Candidatus Woesearchaeota archaeon]